MRFFSTTIIIVFYSVILSVSALAQDPGSLYSSGQTFYEDAQYEQAANNFRESGQLYLQQKDSVNWVRSMYRHGDALMSSGKVQEGLNTLLSIDEHKPQQTPIELKALIKNYIGWAYRQLEQYNNSKEYYLRAIDFANTSDDSVLIGRLNNNISYAYLYTGDYDRAFSHQKKAKEIYESTGEEYRLSFVLNGMFATLRELGLHTQANKYLRQSLAIREKVGNPDLLDVSYHNMAVSYNDMGKPDSSIIYYQKSLELSRMLGNPYDITQTLINIGKMYERSGDHENALAYYNEALEINYQTERPVSIAKNLMQLADVAIISNDLENAETFYTEALNWMEQANSPQTLADLYLDFAQLEIRKQNYDNAESYINEVFNISGERAFMAQQIRGHSLMGELYSTQGDLHESLREFRKAYKLSKERTNTNRIFPAIDLAKAYQKTSSDSSYLYAKEAFSLIDSIRTNVAGLAFRSGFFSQYAGFYNEAASWYIADNKDKKAYDLVESAKARVLMDELAEAENKFFQQLDESTLIKKQQMSKQIDQLYNQIHETENEGDIRALKNQLKDLKFKYQSFVNEIRQTIPEWKNFEYPEALTAKQVMALVPEETAILEFAYTEQQLMIFLVTGNDVKSIVIDNIAGQNPMDHLTNLISSYRNRIIDQAPVKELNEISHPLYEILVERPLSISDETINKLVIVPEGNLTFLPFEALHNSKDYLIEEINIKYLPSASIYPFIQAPHRATSFDILAVAGSGFVESTVGTGVSSQDNFASLPSTLIEVESISKNFEKAKILKNDDVTEAGIKSHDLSEFRFLHFATHGTIDEVNPSQSGLILSKKTGVEALFGEDGYLNSTEISGLTLNADLVTLSACNTGMGKIITGEGLIGLQRSFLSAGSSAVMVSLWNIYDRSTADFMSEFYSQLKVHEAADYGFMNRTLDWFGFYKHPLFDYKAKALRDAKLSMISHPYYSHPVHWAPFILIGK
ncbi:MAG: CHAT domain-containing tetratricopeptide repeat protein [Gracilimonas sp.]|nr:CHAT domain-containing tetratricopeptide repeat protein [Gracilimonas sp.]